MDRHVAELLAATLSADANIRQHGEHSLAELTGSDAATSEQAGLIFAQLCLAQNVDIAVRQSAGLALKRYIRNHWSIGFESFLGNPPSLPAKNHIRQTVFAGLSDPARRIRLACANVVSEIASSDWPEEWPSLLDELVQLLADGHPDAVHGAMRVMTDFVSTDLAEDQLLPLANAILPQLLKIVTADQHSAATRADAVSVFEQCLATLFMVKESHPEAAKYATGHVLPQWIQVFKSLLQITIPVQGDATALYICNEIFQTLCTVLVSFPKTLSEDIVTFVDEGSRYLHTLAETYRSACLNDEADTDFNISSDDGQDLSLSRFLGTIIEFLASTSRKALGRHILVSTSADGTNQSTAILQNMTRLAIFYGQLTSDDEDKWLTDVGAFVADEDEELPAATLRAACLDLMSGIFVSFPDVMSTILLQSVAQEAQASYASATAPDSWRSLESALTQLGSASEEVLAQLEQANTSATASNLASELGRIFDIAVTPNLVRTGMPFLQGRAMIVASLFAAYMPDEVQQRLLMTSLHTFEDAQAGLVVKVCALRALKNLFQLLPDSPQLTSLADRIVADLLPLIGQTSGATQILILETLQRSLNQRNTLNDPTLCHSVARSLLGPITGDSVNDPLLSSVLCDVYRSFATSKEPAVEQAVLDTLLPQLSSYIAQPENDETRSAVTAAVLALNSIFDGKSGNLGFSIVAQSLFGLLQRTDDDSILQEGLECLTYVVRKDVDSLIQWQSSSGESGLAALFSVIARCLDPSRSESGGLFVGDLLLHVFRKAGPLVLPVLPDLLKALVVRLATAVTATFSQSLILPFAYLMHSQVDAVLDLLENIHVHNDSGVKVLLTAWSDVIDMIQGFWSIRVCTVALSTMLPCHRQSVDAVYVKGDLIVTEHTSRTIMTRSRAKKNPDQYTQIPFRAKALKTLLKDLDQARQAHTSANNDVLEDDDDEEWEEDAAAESLKDTIDLTHFIGGDASALFGNGDLDDEDDEDLKSDPLYTLDVPTLIAESVKSFATSDPATFQACQPLLNASELHTLHSL